MDISQAIRHTREKLVATLNESGLPIDVLVMLLREAFENVSRQADQMYEELLQKQKEGKDVSGD